MQEVRHPIPFRKYQNSFGRQRFWDRWHRKMHLQQLHLTQRYGNGDSDENPYLLR
jgi:hypothetical protein